MASEWARKRAEETWRRAVRRCSSDPLLKQEIVGPEEIAAALDEARERERWECHRIASDFSDKLGGTAGAVAIRIAARGPMRGPEEGE